LTEHTAPYTQAFFEDRDYLRIKRHTSIRGHAVHAQMIALVTRC